MRLELTERLGKLEEGLAENALGAVARQDLSVDRGIAERAGGHLFADAAGHRLGFHPFEKLGEIAAAGRRLRHGRCGGEACENKGEGKLRCHDGVNS
jgi:hypothetical protein